VRAALLATADWRQAVAPARERGADLIALPHLSFAPYIAAARDRAGLEHAERPPSRSLREALVLAGGAWLAASAYESEGEGVFYVTAYLAGPDGVAARYRQRHLDAEDGRYERMLWSPGHEPVGVAELPWGPTAVLVGSDVRAPAVWAALAGVRVVVAGVSEPAARWDRTRRIAAGMAAAHALTVLLVNRDEEPFGGGVAAFAPDGAELAPADDGLYDVAASADEPPLRRRRGAA
jgi:predicted amidohydrolase